MKFEQAYYTWGEEQISRYEKGLGICASSNRQMSFLDNCLTIGGSFKPESTMQQSEFLIYSYEFDSFVAVAVNPAPVASDGRRNRLCHFFIPQEKNVDIEPEKYLLLYPFEKEKPSVKDIETVELESIAYDYKEILNKYIPDINKLKELLYKTYQCLFREKRMLTIVINQDKWRKTNPTVARELMWMITMLTPVEFRRTLTYGVNTTVNADVINFLFANDAGEDAFSFFMDDVNAPDIEMIPDFIQELARKAWPDDEQTDSLGTARGFLQEILKSGSGLTRKTNSGKLQLSYWRWKLDKGEYLSEKEIEKRVPNILWQVEKSDWYYDFIKTFLKQDKVVEEMTEQSLMTFWKQVILLWMKKCDNLQIENCLQEQELRDLYSLIKKMLIRMYECKKVYFEDALKDLTESSKKYILPDLYAKKTGLYSEFQTIVDINGLEKYLETYQGIEECYEFKEDLYSKGIQLYDNADSSEKNRITNLLKNRIDWNERLENRIWGYCDVNGFVEHLENQISKVEISFVGTYYKKLLKFAIVEQDHDVRSRMKILEGQLVAEYEKWIDIQDMDSFNIIKEEWQHLEETNKIASSDLSGLMKMPSEFIEKNKIEWGKRFWNLLDCEDEFDNIGFPDFCHKYIDIYNVYRNDEFLKQYEEKIWSYINKTRNLSDNFDWKMEFQITVMCEKNKGGMTKEQYFENVDLWHQINGISEEMFQWIYDCKKEKKKLSDFAVDSSYYEYSSRTSNAIRRCYLIWEKIKEDAGKLSEEEFDQINGDSNDCLTKEFMDCLCEIIALNPGRYGIDNYCIITKEIEALIIKDFAEANKDLYQKLCRYKENNKKFVEEVLAVERSSMDQYLKKMQAYFIVSNPDKLVQKNLADAVEYGELVEQMFGNINELIDFRKKGREVVEELKYEIESGKEEENKLFDEINKKYEELKNIISQWEEKNTKLCENDAMYQKICEADKNNQFNTQRDQVPWNQKNEHSEKICDIKTNIELWGKSKGYQDNAQSKIHNMESVQEYQVFDNRNKKEVDVPGFMNGKNKQKLDQQREKFTCKYSEDASNKKSVEKPDMKNYS